MHACIVNIHACIDVYIESYLREVQKSLTFLTADSCFSSDGMLSFTNPGQECYILKYIQKVATLLNQNTPLYG